MDQTRRSFLAGAAGATALALAGCLGGGDESDFESHEASSGVESQPTIGSLEAPGIIVGFEDPSCRACGRFEEETFPQLEEELLSSGDAAFVYRTLDITFPWGRPAAQVMASTYAADPDAFWGLKSFYYENQSEFDSDTVFELTEPYLRESPVDAESVLDAARAKEHDEFIEENRQAAEALDVSATPEFYLFRDGEFRTSISGPQDYDVFASALGFE